MDLLAEAFKVLSRISLLQNIFGSFRAGIPMNRTRRLRLPLILIPRMLLACTRRGGREEEYEVEEEYMALGVVFLQGLSYGEWVALLLAANVGLTYNLWIERQSLLSKEAAVRVPEFDSNK
ncbi:unnamed protein product [Arabidopsis lyrata]|nr:unnamed protein product [Arabidopsis lyrata]